MAGVGLPDNLLAGLVPGLSGRRAEKKKEAQKAGSFRHALREAESAESAPAPEPFSEAEAAELLDSVHAAGEDLKRDPSPERIRAYKSAVRNFTHYVVERA